MRQGFARQLLVTSLAVTGAGAAAVSAGCSSSDPPLPASATIPIASVAPPAISGGTLMVTHAGLAVAADSDRDLVWLVSAAGKVTKVALQAGDEPGRVAEDAAGRIHVALRGAGSVATIDVAKAAVVDRTPVCPAPRGLAYDSYTDVVHVACAGGELVDLPAAGGQAIRSLRLDRDLRDVIVEPTHDLLITKFRSAEVLLLDPEGNLRPQRATPPSPNNGNDFIGGTFTPTVAWRAIPTGAGDGSVFVAHQLAADTQVVISQPDGYGGGQDGNGCDQTIVKSSVTAFNVAGLPVSATPAPTLVGATLPVDLAVDGSGNVLVVSAGSDSVFMTQADVLQGPSSGGCNTPEQLKLPGQPVAAAGGGAFASQGFVVQLREPPALIVTNGTEILQSIPLPGESRADTGHSLFHHQASGSSFIACAGCHPEGHDDGHVWQFDTEGKRRTPTVAGGILDTVPLHWNGDMHDLNDIMEQVFVHRMGGAHQGPQHVAAFGDWLNAIPPMPASPTGAETEIAHGKEIFERADVGCTTCHSGAHFTNNKNENVGTGRAFQVPQLLGVAARTPLMHDGCAKTLADRFDPKQVACNGGDSHGHWTQLSADDLKDLVKYLETL